MRNAKSVLVKLSTWGLPAGEETHVDQSCALPDCRALLVCRSCPVGPLGGKILHMHNMRGTGNKFLIPSPFKQTVPQLEDVLRRIAPGSKPRKEAPRLIKVVRAEVILASILVRYREFANAISL